MSGEFPGEATAEPPGTVLPRVGTRVSNRSGSAKELLRLVAAAIFYYTGLVWVALQVARRRSKRHLMILNYHRAIGGDLRHHLLYLRRHYRVLPLEEALAVLYRPKPESSRDRRTPLVITFDDGYQDNYTQLFPLARALGVPVAIFLIPGYLDSGDVFWWLAGPTLVDQAWQNGLTRATLAGCTFHLADPTQRQALAKLIDSQLRYAHSVAAREAALAAARLALAVPPTGAPPTDDAAALAALAARPLSWDQVAEMAASGWVTFGAHTQHHPVLACLDDPTELARELVDCRAALQARLGHPVRTLAYPIGAAEHVGPDAPRLAGEAGYQWAVSMIPGVCTKQTDPLLLRRIGAETADHWLLVAARAAGVRIPGLLFTPPSKTKVAPRPVVALREDTPRNGGPVATRVEISSVDTKAMDLTYPTRSTD